MTGYDGVTYQEEIVLQPLEDSPLPLWEIAEDFVRAAVGEPPAPQAVAEILAPALTSLATHGLIEVRRFDVWPAPWEAGVPVDPDRLLHESQHAEAWSRGRTHDLLAAHITEVGIRWL
ncbi:hypothetical protein GCM10022251_38720 [Phytohabitans flavus]|uniref:Uncharacterized protein n=1 Tax=Phytohabitans flavus TaxID=1076124 RepID=A0A6F8XVF3_9ACTN|nr:hypothetical protein [Phytohabitans flavus]BCB77803.1 hypothetical protein Pflav_042130 [Phytohabitans flavus]